MKHTERMSTLSSISKTTFWCLLLFGFLIRIWKIGHASYFIDEVNLIRDSATAENYGTIFMQELERFNWYHRLPLLGIIIHAASQLLAPGTTYPAEWITRIPFALIGTATLPILYLATKQITRSSQAALWTMALSTLSVFHIYYSRETYDYSLVMFFTSGTLWMAFKLLHTGTRLTWPNCIFFVFFATGSLYSHLTCLIWLSCLSLIMAVCLLVSVKPRLWISTLWPWAVLMLTPYLIFSPFLHSLLIHGFTETDSLQHVYYLQWSSPIALLGRMGWGESFFRLLAFGIIAVSGFFVILRKKFGWVLMTGCFLFLCMLFMSQRSGGRFEIRYYSALFPLLMIAAGAGCSFIVTGTTAKFGKRGKWGMRAMLIVLLLFCQGPSVKAVVDLKYRGYYKYVAEWLNENVPENGIYAYNNVYELRGIPSVYPTPNRYPAYPFAWDGWRMYHQQHAEQHLISMFTRFPLMVFINERPQEYLSPKDRMIPPLPRNKLFINQVLLEDPAFQKLVHLHTHPNGNVQPGYEYADRIMIMYNTPEDLPELARRNGKNTYHYFGREWKYMKDQQMRDWRFVTDQGTIHFGKVSGSGTNTELRLTAVLPPHGGKVQLVNSNGRPIGNPVDISGNTIKEYHWQLPHIEKGTETSYTVVCPQTMNSSAGLLVHSADLIEQNTTVAHQ